MFEKDLLWYFEIEFFPWFFVDFSLYHCNFLVQNGAQVCAFWYVLSNEFVCIFNVAFLP